MEMNIMSSCYCVVCYSFATAEPLSVQYLIDIYYLWKCNLIMGTGIMWPARGEIRCTPPEFWHRLLPARLKIFEEVELNSWMCTEYNIVIRIMVLYGVQLFLKIEQFAPSLFSVVWDFKITTCTALKYQLYLFQACTLSRRNLIPLREIAFVENYCPIVNWKLTEESILCIMTEGGKTKT